MSIMLRALLVFLLALPAQARACDLALFLAVDVSGSVDHTEYRVQMDGLAAALRDGVVSEALVRSNARVALAQWSGTTRQHTSIDWIEIRTFKDTDDLADRIGSDARRWRNFSTAIGEALLHGMSAFSKVPDCRRKVIDVSGDGVSNEGVPPREILSALRKHDITVNALVIETDDSDLTGYFWENVITGENAFVVTANGFQDYPARIRQKLIRETTKQLAANPHLRTPQ